MFRQKEPALKHMREKKLDFEIIEKEEVRHVPDIRLQPGAIVQISGEYICLGCRTSRMWLKGDVAKECENAGMRPSGDRMEMTYELF